MGVTQTSRGWVYVIGNRSMPGLWKIGFTERSPKDRADEMSHTGMPLPYDVAYQVEVETPRDIEQAAHKILSPIREGKEWFRCNVEEAISAIKVAANSRSVYSEIYILANQEQVETIYKLALKKRRKQRLLDEAAERLRLAEEEIHQKYEVQIKACSETFYMPFRYYWIGCGVFIWLMLVLFGHVRRSSDLIILPVIFGGILGFILKEYIETKYQRSDLYLSTQNKWQTELQAVRAKHAVEIKNI